MDSKLLERVDRIKVLASKLNYAVNVTPTQLSDLGSEIIDKGAFCGENYDPIGEYVYAANLAFFLISTAPVPFVKSEWNKEINIEKFRDAVEKAELFAVFMAVAGNETDAITKMRDMMCGVMDVKEMIMEAVKDADVEVPKDAETLKKLQMEGDVALEKFKEVWKEEFSKLVDDEYNVVVDRIIQNDDGTPSYRAFLQLFSTMIYVQCRFGLMIPLHDIIVKLGVKIGQLPHISGEATEEESPDEYLSKEALDRLTGILGKLDQKDEQ